MSDVNVDDAYRLPEFTETKPVVPDSIPEHDVGDVFEVEGFGQVKVVEADGCKDCIFKALCGTRSKTMYCIFTGRKDGKSVQYRPVPSPPAQPVRVIAVADVVAKVDEILRSFPEMAHSGRWRRIDKLRDWLAAPEPVAEDSEPTPSAVERIREKVKGIFYDAVELDNEISASDLKSVLAFIDSLLSEPDANLVTREWHDAEVKAKRMEIKRLRGLMQHGPSQWPYSEIRTRYMDLNKWNDRLRDELAEAKSGLKSLRAKVIERNKQMCKLRGANERLTEELEEVVNEVVQDGGITTSTPNAVGQPVPLEPTPHEMVAEQSGNLRRLQAENERLRREKAARVYYQTIVYEVCNVLDALRGDGKIVCGTVETPTSEVQVAMKRLQKQRDDLGCLCEEINHAIWPDPDFTHDTSEAPAAIDHLHKLLNNTINSKVKLRKQLADAEARHVPHRVAELEVQVHNLETGKKQLAEQLKTERGQRKAVIDDALTAEVERLRAENAQQAGDHRAINKARDAESEHFRNKLAETQSTANKLRDKVTVRNNQLQELRAESEDWRKRLEEGAHLNVRLEDKCRGLRNSVSLLKKRLSDAEARVTEEIIVLVREVYDELRESCHGTSPATRNRIRVLFNALLTKLQPEPMTFAEAVEMGMAGKCSRRRGNDEAFISPRAEGIFVAELVKEDVDATDWEVVKE